MRTSAGRSKKQKLKKAETDLENTAARISATMKRQGASAAWSQAQISKLRQYDGKVGPVPVDIIRAHENIRQNIDPESPEQKQLVASIAKHGILQPPVVTVIKDQKGVWRVLLIAGERRLQAAKQLEYADIPCMVRLFDESGGRLTASMSENINRQSLSTLEIADGYGKLSSKGYKYAELEILFGRNEKTIGRFVKISKWPQRVRTLIEQHPKKLNTKFLFSLASRKLTHEEVYAAIQGKLGGKDTGPSATKMRTLEKAESWCKDLRLNRRDKQLVLRALTELGLVPAPEAGGKRTPK